MTTQRETKPKPAAVVPAQPEPDRLAVELSNIIRQNISWLALGEDDIGALARRILRFERDEAPIEEYEDIAKPLFISIGKSIIDQVDQEPIETRVDSRSGSTFHVWPLKRTPELKAILRKMRKTSAA
jgi:hypothetical protein